MLGLAGVTAIDCRARRLTVSDGRAGGRRCNGARRWSRCPSPGGGQVRRARPLEIVATEVVADAQVTWLVRSCVELSE